MTVFRSKNVQHSQRIKRAYTRRLFHAIPWTGTFVQLVAASQRDAHVEQRYSRAAGPAEWRCWRQDGCCCAHVLKKDPPKPGSV